MIFRQPLVVIVMHMFLKQFYQCLVDQLIQIQPCKFKHFHSLVLSSKTDCVTEINNMQTDVEDLEAVMPMYDLSENINNYVITSKSLHRYIRYEPNINKRISTFQFKTKSAWSLEKG